MGYIISGKGEYGYALVRILHADSRERADELLKEFIESTDAHDMRAKEGHTDFRVEETKPEDEWWNDPFLAN